jgi:hypothetical protein
VKQFNRQDLIEFGGNMNTIKAFKKDRFLGIFLIILIFPLASSAEIRADRSIGIQGLYTLVLGAGLEVSYNLGDHLAIGVNYYAMTAEGSGENSENSEVVKFDLSTAELFLRLYPFAGSGFYISGAAVARNWKVTDEGYTDDFQGTTEQANYKITAEWPNTGYAYGLGGNWVTHSGFSWGMFLGVLTGGNPELKGEVDNTNITQADIDKEIDQFEEDEDFGSKYNTAPLLRIAFGYNF